MIGYWYNPVVCLSVTLSIVVCRVGQKYEYECTGLKMYSVFLAHMFLFVRSDTFAVGCMI